MKIVVFSAARVCASTMLALSVSACSGQSSPSLSPTAPTAAGALTQSTGTGCPALGNGSKAENSGMTFVGLLSPEEAVARSVAQITDAWYAQYDAALIYSWRRFQLLVGDDYGVRWLPTYESGSETPSGVLASVYPGFEHLDDRTNPFPGGPVMIMERGGAVAVTMGAQGGMPSAPRYRLNFGVTINNPTNRANYFGYSGVMTSPFFKKPISLDGVRTVSFRMGLSF